jgi:SAM-dependent methyltransferase
MRFKKKCDIILKELKKGNMTLDLGSVGIGDMVSVVHDYLVKNYDGRIISVDMQKGADIVFDLNELKWTFAKDNSVDNIVASELIEHLLRPYDFLLECHRILKNDGRLILTTPNAIGLNRILRSREHEPTEHLYIWLPHQLKKLVDLAGFKVIREYRIDDWHNRFFIFKLIARVFSKYQGVLIFVCEKK